MQRKTVSQGWVPSDTTPPLSGHTYEVLTAGGVTFLAHYDHTTRTIPQEPTIGPEGELIPREPLVVSWEWWQLDESGFPGEAFDPKVYAWRVALSGWEPFPATDRPWFPIASADRLRAGCLVEVLCHSGKTGRAWLQLQEPTAEAPEGELGWEWADPMNDEGPVEPAFWRFHLDSRTPAQEASNLTLQLHPTVRKHNLFLGELLKPAVDFVVPVEAPGFTQCPSFPSLLEGTSPEVELVEIWAAANDLATWAADPARNSGQLYFLEHRLAGIWGPLSGFIGEQIARAGREGR